MTNQVAKMMSLLGCSEEEALQVIEDDKRIDKGEDLFPLSKEQKAVEKKMKNCDVKKPTVYKFDTRAKKVDEDKRFLVNILAEILDNVSDEATVDILNPERELEFLFKGRKFKIVLSCPRS
jgi:hypothetical protein